MKGYIALTTVLIILPLLLLSGIDSLYKNMTTLIVGKMNYDAQILKSNTETCLEEAVYIIKRNPSFADTLTVSLDNWTCTVLVSDKGGSPGVKIIDIQASDSNGIYINTLKELDTNADPFEVSNI